MYHQAPTRLSELTASRNFSSLRLPRVGAWTLASATASAGDRRRGSGPASTGKVVIGLVALRLVAVVGPCADDHPGFRPAPRLPCARWPPRGEARCAPVRTPASPCPSARARRASRPSFASTCRRCLAKPRPIGEAPAVTPPSADHRRRLSAPALAAVTSAIPAGLGRRESLAESDQADHSRDAGLEAHEYAEDADRQPPQRLELERVGDQRAQHRYGEPHADDPGVRAGPLPRQRSRAPPSGPRRPPSPGPGPIRLRTRRRPGC